MKKLFFRGVERRLKMEISRFEQLTQVVCRFGNSLKGLSINEIVLPSNFIELLNLMPNLEEIEMQHIGVEETVFKGNLQLHKLKKIETLGCGQENLNLFNSLPSGVLRELNLGSPYPTYASNDYVNKLFSNQHNIKKITTPCEFINFFESKQAKFKEIEVERNYIPDDDIQNFLLGQDEVEKLKINYIDEIIVNLICNELKSLINLEIAFVSTLTTLERAELSKLRNLKNLRLDFHNPKDQINKFLSLAQNESLEKLKLKSEFTSLTEEAMRQLGLNFPNLKELEVRSKS